MARLFVALTLPETVRRHLSLLGGGVPGARWQTVDQMHLTLRFIGEVDGRTEGDVIEALSTVTMPAFPLTIAGVGAFGDRRRPQVIWAGVRAQPELDRLQAKVESALQRIGLAPERRKFLPHVTLARLRDGHSGRVGDFLAANGVFSTAPFTVAGFTLYSSFLSHGGAIYRPEAIYDLAGGWAPADLAEMDDDEADFEADLPAYRPAFAY